MANKYHISTTSGDFEIEAEGEPTPEALQSAVAEHFSGTRAPQSEQDDPGTPDWAKGTVWAKKKYRDEAIDSEIHGLSNAPRLAGAILGSEGGVSGAALSGGGEKIAQFIEGKNDPRALAQASGMGAIPFGKISSMAKPILKPLVAPAVAGGTNLVVNKLSDLWYGADENTPQETKQAMTVAAVTAAMPILGKILAMGGRATGIASAAGPALANPERQAALAGGIKNDMSVIPSSVGRNDIVNNLLESTGGMGALKKAAQAKNDIATEIAAKKHAGIPEHDPINLDTLDARRTDVSGPYSEAQSLGDNARAAIALREQRVAARPPVSGGQEAAMAAEESPAHAAVMKSLQVQAGADLASLQQASHDLNDAYRTGKTSMERQPIVDKVQNLTDGLEAAANESGDPGLIGRVQEAKKAMAKTYDIQETANHGDGSVSLAKLGRRYQKNPGKMTDEGAEIGRFANSFQKSGVIGDGRAQMNPGNSGTNMLAAIMGGFKNLPALAVKATGIPAARAGARQILLSRPYQRSLLTTPAKMNPQIEAIMQRMAALQAVRDSNENQ